MQNLSVKEVVFKTQDGKELNMRDSVQRANVNMKSILLVRKWMVDFIIPIPIFMASTILKNLETSNNQTLSNIKDIVSMLNEKNPKHADILDKAFKPA